MTNVYLAIFSTHWKRQTEIALQAAGYHVLNNDNTDSVAEMYGDLSIIEIDWPQNSWQQLLQDIKYKNNGHTRTILLIDHKLEDMVNIFDLLATVEGVYDAYVTMPFSPEEIIFVTRNLLQGNPYDNVSP